MAETELRDYLEELKSLVEQGRHDEVTAHGRHILQHYPKHLATYRVMGEAMLEAGDGEKAEDLFNRVLSGDPEDHVARVGLSIVYDRRNDLEMAIWHMERAFELVPDNDAIRGEMRRLYGRRDGVEPGRLELTRGALARVYARGALYARAIGEFRALLAEDPGRVDLQAALAEALWRNEQRVQAEEVCLRVLERLPLCLKANLILGEIYTRTGRAEGRECFRRAEALDPENSVAAEMFGDDSPLQPRLVRVPRSTYAGREERPAWVAEGERAAAVDVGRALVDPTSSLERQIEIPAWLEEITLGDEEGEAAEGPDEEPAEDRWVPDQPGPPGEAAPLPETLVQDLPDWLEGVSAEAVDAAPADASQPEAPVPVEMPDWLAELTPLEVRQADRLPEDSLTEVPAWLGDVSPRGEREAEAPPIEPGGMTEAELPEWLAETVALDSVTPAPPAGGQPAPADIPSWLEEKVPPAELPAAVADSAVPAVEAAMPSWLEGEGLPSGDEALRFLESLMAGKEDELRAAAESEARARVAEITGVAGQPEEVPAPPVQPRPVPVLEEETPAVVPSWLEAAVPGEEEAPAAVEPPAPSWLEGEGMPSGDEALAFLESLVEGKEDELRAAAEMEAQIRLAEITGRGEPLATEPPVAVGPAPAAAAEEEPLAAGLPEWLSEAVEAEEIEPVPEAFGWSAFGEEGRAEVVFEAPGPSAADGAAEIAVPVGMPVAAGPAVPPAEPPAAVVQKPVLPVEEGRAVTEREIAVEAKPIAPELAALQEYVRSHPRDYGARLALARQLWDAGLHDESAEAYSRALRSAKLAEEVLADVEAHARERPADPAVRRVLGDAYMRVGRLEEALATYRSALESL